VFTVFSSRCWVAVSNGGRSTYSGFPKYLQLQLQQLSTHCLRIRVTLRLAVYRQSVHLGAKPLEAHDLYFFPTEHLRLYSLRNILSNERMGRSFTIAAGPRQRIHCSFRVQRHSWPYYTVSDSRLHQPGGPGPRIYISQEQGGPVITPGTGFPFLRLLRLAGLL
jgi:hypothetical protein